MPVALTPQFGITAYRRLHCFWVCRTSPRCRAGLAPVGTLRHGVGPRGRLQIRARREYLILCRGRNGSPASGQGLGDQGGGWFGVTRRDGK